MRGHVVFIRIPETAGRSSWLRSTDRISVFKLFIGVGKVKIPKTVNDVPCRAGYGIRVRIIFT